MKIVSYNVNGIRAAVNKGFMNWLQEENPDILCLQEIKAMPEQVNPEAFQALGYFSLINPAEKKGYSGVALFSKQVPDFYSFGINKEVYDTEGRVIRADFGNLTIVCVYVPAGISGEIRQAYKMEFLKDFFHYLHGLKKERPEILLCGDFNISHKEIDLYNPEKYQFASGFLPEERKWLDELLEDGFIDTFREFDHSAEKYTWWSYMASARAKNRGWRLDYHFITEPVKARLKNACILPQVVHSDHCPVVVELDN
ncbi:MAG: exodeoxyribonuclease III [Candidatus Azobacteroides sp.]|nr:exodeoxyribonuclease III [Candidatus Azobacteroides sp.]